MSDVDREQPLISHLIELRTRLLRIAGGILVVFVVLSPFSNPIYTALAVPLTRHMPAQSSMIAIDVLSPFLTPLKFTLILAVFITIPWILYQVWAFVAPGLYAHEKRLALPLVAASAFLFFVGMAFAYFLVFPTVFGFMARIAPDGVAWMTDIEKYLAFVMSTFIAFGVTFEVPVVVVVLVRMGVVEIKTLKEWRPYVIVGAFVIGAIFTPPDVISQLLLAIPLCLLYELGILLARFVSKPVSETANLPAEID